MNSLEFDNVYELSENSVIKIIQGKFKDKKIGGSLRTGNYNCKIENNTLAHRIYKKNEISERHRHRYEFNNDFLHLIKKSKNGILSGKNEKNNLYEIFELSDHPFFISTQFHPEFKSKPNEPHPLFISLIKSIYKIQI